MRVKVDDMNPEDRMLREWEIKETLPPRFQERVWQRIAREEAKGIESVWVLARRRFAQLLVRPALAGSYLAVLLLAGLLAGYWQARVEQARTLEQLGSRYVQMLDPYQGDSSLRRENGSLPRQENDSLPRQENDSLPRRLQD